MTITDIRVRHIFDSESNAHLRAVVSVTFDDMLAVHDIRVIESDGRLFISMPNTVDKAGKRRDTVHPINAKTRSILEDAVITAYKEAATESSTAEA